MIKLINAAHRERREQGKWCGSDAEISCWTSGWIVQWSECLCPQKLCTETLTPSVGRGSRAIGSPAGPGDRSLVSRIGPFQKGPTHSSFDSSHMKSQRDDDCEKASRLSPDSVISNWSRCFQSWEKLVSIYTPPALWHRCCSNPNWLQQIVRVK